MSTMISTPPPSLRVVGDDRVGRKDLGLFMTPSSGEALQSWQLGSMKRCQGRNLRSRIGATEKVAKGFKAATMHLGVRWVRPAMRNVSRSASRHRAGFAGTAATRKCRFINVATVSPGGKHTLGISAPNMQRVAMLGSSRLDKDPSSRIQLHVKRSNARRSSPGRR